MIERRGGQDTLITIHAALMKGTFCVPEWGVGLRGRGAKLGKDGKVLKIYRKI